MFELVPQDIAGELGDMAEAGEVDGVISDNAGGEEVTIVWHMAGGMAQQLCQSFSLSAAAAREGHEWNPSKNAICPGTGLCGDMRVIELQTA
jgi:hypothetical protein